MNLSGIECRDKREKAALCYSQAINQHRDVRRFRYSDLSEIFALKVGVAKNLCDGWTSVFVIECPLSIVQISQNLRQLKIFNFSFCVLHMID